MICWSAQGEVYSCLKLTWKHKKKMIDGWIEGMGREIDMVKQIE